MTTIDKAIVFDTVVDMILSYSMFSDLTDMDIANYLTSPRFDPVFAGWIMSLRQEEDQNNVK